MSGVIQIPQLPVATTLASTDLIIVVQGGITYQGTLGQIAPTLDVVTSVGLSLPSELTVSGSPVTTTGTLTATWASQTANLMFASPNGSAGAPLFRTFAAADLPNSGVSAGTYGAGDAIPVLTVDAYGRVTSATTIAVSSATAVPWSVVTGTPTTASGYGITNVPTTTRAVTAGTGLAGGGTLASDVTLALATTTVTPATVGSGSLVPVITIDAYGRITTATTAAVAAATSTVTAGSYGNSTETGTFTVDLYGRLTTASNVTVTPTWASVQGVPDLVSSLAALTATGILVKTSATAVTARTLTGSAGLDVTNGDGVAGNPTLTINDDYAMLSRFWFA